MGKGRKSKQEKQSESEGYVAEHESEILAAVPDMDNTGDDIETSIDMKNSKGKRGGRALSAVWNEFTVMENPHTLLTAPCRWCNKFIPYHRKSEQARIHLKKCVAYLQELQG